VPEGTGAASAPADETDTLAIFGTSSGFVAPECGCPLGSLGGSGFTTIEKVADFTVPSLGTAPYAFPLPLEMLTCSTFVLGTEPTPSLLFCGPGLSGNFPATMADSLVAYYEVFAFAPTTLNVSIYGKSLPFASVPFYTGPITGGGPFWIRQRFEIGAAPGPPFANVYRVRAWAGTPADEPATWNIYDGTLSSAFWDWNAPAAVCFDDRGFFDAPHGNWLWHVCRLSTNPCP
jgi:hypothetical protein